VNVEKKHCFEVEVEDQSEERATAVREGSRPSAESTSQIVFIDIYYRYGCSEMGFGFHSFTKTLMQSLADAQAARGRTD